MQKFDAAQLEQIKSLVPISRLVGEYVAAAPKSSPGDLWGLCPVHGERTPSFHAEDAKGLAHCFGCGFNEDHYGFLQKVGGMTFTQAVQHMADLAGVTLEGERDKTPRRERAKYDAPKIVDPYQGYEFVPVPEGAPLIVPGKKTPPVRRPKEVGTDKEFTTYTPSAVHPYYSAAGELLGYVVRQDLADGKKVTPGLWWVKAPDGYEGWSHGSLPALRPLYGLKELLARPDAQVLVVEGEKCRDAAHSAIGARLVVVSWLGGTSAVRQTDWSPLHGRSLIFWPDNDDGGSKAIRQAHSLAKGLRNKRVTEYGTKGGDVADLIADGGSVADYIKANISEWKGIQGGNISENGTARLGSGERHSHSGSDNLGGSSGVSNSNRSAHGSVGEAKLNDPTHNSPHSQPNSQPDPTPEDHKASAQGLGHVGREAAVEEDEAVDPVLSTADDFNWEQKLVRTDKGTHAKKSPQNTALFIQFHEEFKGIFAFNSFSREIMLMRRPPWEPGKKAWTPRVMDEDDETALQGQLEYCEISIGINDLSRAISRVAKHNRFNPVLDKLKSLEWDGIQRLSGDGKMQGWLTRYFGAAPTEINRVFGRKWFISAVSRIVLPGQQVDTVLIIEGGQGAMKSTSFRAICAPFGDDYFLDNLADPYSKDGKMAVQGKLIVELAELEAFRRSEESQKKSWITTRIDEFRPPFGRMVRKYPRTFVIVGTENPTGTGYLKDSTGARRYWPVSSNEIDFDLLKEDVTQLWAEAYAAHKSGETWWLTKEEEMLAAVEQRKRFKHDPWMPSIANALKGEVSTNPHKLMDVLDIPRKDRTIAGNDRIVAVLTMMQWEARTVDGETLYYRPVLN